MSRYRNVWTSSLSWADRVFEELVEPFEVPEDLAESGDLVSRFPVNYNVWTEASSPANRDWDGLCGVQAVDDPAAAAALEMVRRTGEVHRVEVEHWMVRTGRSQAIGVVVVLFPNGLRLAHMAGPYAKAGGDKRPVVQAAARAQVADARRLPPPLRFSPICGSPMHDTLKQERSDEWLTGLLCAALSGWRRQAETIVEGRAEQVRLGQSRDRVEQVMARYETEFKAQGLCVFPLVELGWYYSERIYLFGPSDWYNDDNGWALDAAPELGHPDVSCIRGHIALTYPGGRSESDHEVYGDSLTPRATQVAESLCGAVTRTGQKMCAVHDGLPYKGMVTPQAWDHIGKVIVARREALFHEAAAWASVEGSSAQP